MTRYGEAPIEAPLDPRPWCDPDTGAHYSERDMMHGVRDVFDPRPGYEQDRSKYGA